MQEHHVQRSSLRHQRTRLVDALVTVERPQPAELARFDRRKKLAILEENARQHRDELVKWIEEQGLAREVDSIGAATSFNILLVKGTPKVVRALKKAPGVLAVTMADDAAALMR
ncbi:MAG: hypothetical protein DCC55_22920 [Chloroflexi bacterium]|nr:MAG: hypothetical protein DCC55_22920 [Chloroflexota bacterium]